MITINAVRKAGMVAVVGLFGLYESSHAAPALAIAPASLAALVNPLVGTDGQGNTFPGAVAPFGMMQLSPNWKDNGYYYPQLKMHGFVVNLMSGTGPGDQGQVLMTATTGPVKVARADTDFNFSHADEKAAAGYYQVKMQPWNINAEMTTTTRCGLLRYTFPAGKTANILLPLSYANTPVHSSAVRVLDDHTVSGQVTSEVLDGERNGVPVYFVMSFSRPFATHGTWTNDKLAPGSDSAAQTDRKTVIGFYGSYPAAAGEQTVEVRIGMSYVDEAGALKNLNIEMPDGGLDKYRERAANAWEEELRAIEVEGGTLEHRRIFYTALYHALIAPGIFEDADGRYTGFDGKIHQVSAGHSHVYATFSGWDIYRTQIPLLGIIKPKRAADMAQSIVEMGKQLGFIDRWPQLNQPCGVMSGEPLTICLANLWNAGIRNFDMETAYRQMWKQAQVGATDERVGNYQGFNEEKKGITLNADASVSTALEYNVAFAALGNLARDLGKPDDARYLWSRALQYRQMYNPVSGYLQSRTATGLWNPSFNDYCEANRDIYLWFVPHDVQGLVDLMGGPATFDQRLDEFFEKGRYDSGNEPDIQAPFFYDYINRPWKTQRIVAQTADRVFRDTPSGLAGGNDDMGTMSSWYILSQLGFYPVDPGSAYFVVCTPRFQRTTIHLEAPHTGKQFVIEAPAAAPDAIYIQSATLNGAPLNKPWFDENAITAGGTWTVAVSAQPNQKWGDSPFDRPPSLSTGRVHLPQNPVVKSFDTAQSEPVMWRYNTQKVADDWFKTNFNDSAWKVGPGGFGTPDPGVTPRTAWTSDDIWMRRTVTLPQKFGPLLIMAYHDQDMDVYLNGVLAVRAPGFTQTYVPFQISAEAAATLHAGANVMALHVHRPGEGGHFADATLAGMEWPESEK